MCILNQYKNNNKNNIKLKYEVYFLTNLLKIVLEVIDEYCLRRMIVIFFN